MSHKKEKESTLAMHVPIAIQSKRKKNNLKKIKIEDLRLNVTSAYWINTCHFCRPADSPRFGLRSTTLKLLVLD